MSSQPAPARDAQTAQPTLEVVWQDDATALAFTRDADGTLSAGGLRLGLPAIADVVLGGSARAICAVVRLAHRSVAEGLVHPSLDNDGGWWHAFWGATLDEGVQSALAGIAAALPPVGAGAFGGDVAATVHDLYPVLVDQIARDRLRAEGVRLAPRRAGRTTAIE